MSADAMTPVERQREKRQQAREQGLCSTCFKRPAAPGYGTCVTCSQQRSARTHQEHQTPRTPKPKTTPRTCLGPDCGRTFASTGPENRLCPRCRELAHGRSDGPEPRSVYIVKRWQGE